MKKPRRRKQTKSGSQPCVAPAVSSLTERADQALASPLWRWAVPALILTATLAVSAWTFDEKLSYTGDNTEFIILARSVAQGQGLSLISRPVPTPGSKFPPGFPAILAPVAALFPMDGETATPDWVAMKWVVVLLFAGSMSLFYLLMSDQWARLPALAVTLLCLTNPLLVDYGHQVMSEVPYLFCSVLSLLLIERSMRRKEVGRNYLFYGGLAAIMGAYYVRSVGVVLVAAVILYTVQQRHYLKALVTAAVAVAAALPWLLRNRALGKGSFYLKQLLLENPYYAERGLMDLSSYSDRLWFNGMGYLTREIPGVLYPPLRPLEELASWTPDAGALLHVSTLILVAIAVYTVYLCMRRGQHLIFFNYVILLMGTQIVWPWMSDRFLIPMLPFFVFFAVRVAADVVERMRAGALRWGAMALVSAAGVVFLAANVSALNGLVETADGEYAPNYFSYYSIGQWLNENSSEDAVILCRKPFWMYVVSGRKSVVYPYKDPSAVMASIDERGVDYVVVGELSLTTRRHLVPTIRTYPQRFELLLQVRDTETYLFGIRR